MNTVHIIDPIMQVNRTMQENVSNTRFNDVPGGIMVPHADQFRLGYFSHPMLTGCKEKITQAEKCSRTRSPNAPMPNTQYYQDKKWQTEQRINDGNQIPGNFLQSKRPQEMRPVTGAGIQQPMSSIAQKAGYPRFTKGETSARKKPNQQCHDRRTQRNKHQGVGEVPMIIQVQKRVSRGTN